MARTSTAATSSTRALEAAARSSKVGFAGEGVCTGAVAGAAAGAVAVAVGFSLTGAAGVNMGRQAVELNDNRVILIAGGASFGEPAHLVDHGSEAIGRTLTWRDAALVPAHGLNQAVDFVCDLIISVTRKLRFGGLPQTVNRL